MNFIKYRKEVTTFAVYENKEYPFWGLVSEVGELFGKVAKELRGDKVKDKETFILELGDVCWFVAEILNTYNIELKGVLNQFSLNITNSVIKLDNVYFKSILNNNNEIYTNYMFIKDKELTSRELNLFKQLLFENNTIILSNISALSNHLGIAFKEVLHRNIEKLDTRKKNKTIKGDGDFR